jgi:hypothetical protein
MGFNGTITTSDLKGTENNKTGNNKSYEYSKI